MRTAWIGLLTLVASISASRGAVVYLDDGQELVAEVSRVTPSGVTLQIDDAAGTVTSVPLNRVKWVEFETTPDWDAAEVAFSVGKFEEAGRLFTAIAADRQSNYYPVPGNLSSMAILRILECHRRLLNGERVASVAERIRKELNSLPPHLREFSREDRAWIAAGTEKWEEVVAIGEEVTLGNTELYYLAGLAHVALGNTEEALDGFTQAYSLGFGSHPAIARISLQKAAEILYSLGDEQRLPELKAQLKIYQELYGSGKLWDGAPPRFSEIAISDLETMEISLEEEELVIPPLPELPPKESRDWLLAYELKNRAYVVGQGAFAPLTFENAPPGPGKQGNDLVFTGAESLGKSGFAINANVTRVRIVFIPESGDGSLLRAGKPGMGWEIYLEGGQAFLAWSVKTDGPVETIALGPVSLRGQTELVLNVVGSQKIVRGRVSPQAAQELGKVSSPIASKDKATVVISPGKGIHDLVRPRFKGVIRHLSVGFAKSGQDMNAAEAKMFGKRVVLAVPAEEG